MLTVKIVLFIVLASAAAYCAVRAVRAFRAESKRRLLAESYRTAVDVDDGPGISLLCGEADVRRLQHLLEVEYPRYEVVVTLDANDDYARFAEVVGRYGMVRVSRSLSHELPAIGIRALYRSGDRRFRRLIVVDKLATSENDDRNAAACYASYDYLLPLPDGCMLAEDAVERLAVAVSECEGRGIAVIRTDTGAPAALYDRETVVAAGGFGSEALGRLPAEKVFTLHELLIWCPVGSSSLLASGLGLAPAAGNGGMASRRVAIWSLRGVAAIIILAVLFAAARAGWLTLTAALVTLAAAWSTACYVVLLSGQAPRYMRLQEARTDELDEI